MLANSRIPTVELPPTSRNKPQYEQKDRIRQAVEACHYGGVHLRKGQKRRVVVEKCVLDLNHDEISDAKELREDHEHGVR